MFVHWAAGLAIVLATAEAASAVTIQTDTLHTMTTHSFGSPRRPDYHLDDSDDLGLIQIIDYYAGVPWEPFFESKTCLYDLGPVDFDSLVVAGIPTDLLPDSCRVAGIHYYQASVVTGHSYAIWTRAGRTVLFHVFRTISLWDVSSERERRIRGSVLREIVNEVVFNWVFAPDSGRETTLDNTGWGFLKKSMSRRSLP